MSTDIETQARTASMTTGKGIGLYTMAIGIMIALIALAANVQVFPGIIAFAGYFVLGFLLNRVVLRGLIEWHPMHNTLANVASAKLGMMMLWPIRYPGLFFQLLFLKHL